MNTPAVRDALLNLGVHHAQSTALSVGLVDCVLNRLPPAISMTLGKATVRVLVERATGWVHSVSKLPDPFDFQAHSAACRAVLETAVDMVLITNEPALAERMAAWEESAKLHSADVYRKFVQKTKAPNPDPVRIDFIAQCEQRIKTSRKSHWGNEGHPRTWYGPPFLQVVAEADRRIGGHYFEGFHADHFARLCWGTHGSSLMMVRAPSDDTIPSLAAIAIVGTLQLAMNLVSHALVFFGEDDKAIGDELAGRMLLAGDDYRAQLLASIGAEEA